MAKLDVTAEAYTAWNMPQVPEGMSLRAVKEILEAVAPAIEAQIRQQIGDSIKRASVSGSKREQPGYHHAEKIARGQA